MVQLDAFAPLSAAEAQLIEDAGSPERVVFDEGELPAEPGDTVSVRAELLRALLLTPGALDAKGLRLRGAHIVGALDLQGCDLACDITFTNCRIEVAMNLISAKLRGLHFFGCVFKGFIADHARLTGSLYIRSGSVVTGELSLAGARIGGDLQICETEIAAGVDEALFAPTLRVEGSIFFGNYLYTDGQTQLIADGALFLASIMVDHGVFISNTAVSRPTGSVAPGEPQTEEQGERMALSLARARIGGILLLQANEFGGGMVNLSGASVARLKDDVGRQDAHDHYPIRLDGFHYENFSRATNTDLRVRLAWLDRRPPGTRFYAQPYEHLAGVLRSLGHRADANMVLMHKERLLRQENRRALAREQGRGLLWAVNGLQDGFLRLSVGYGFRPGRSILFAVLLIVALGWFFDRAWKAGDMAPNAAPILVSDGWIAATEVSDNPGAYWSSDGQAGQDYETFNAYAYAADLVIPLVSLGQEEAWAPSTTRSWWGRVGWSLRWFAKGIGWVVAALAAAALTGVIRTD